LLAEFPRILGDFISWEIPYGSLASPFFPDPVSLLRFFSCHRSFAVLALAVGLLGLLAGCSGNTRWDGVGTAVLAAPAALSLPRTIALFTLVTCWPPWSNTHRVVVTGVLVGK